MMNLYEAIGCRHSVRKYTDREVTEKLRGQILSYFDKTSRLNDRIRVEAVIFDNTKKKADVHGLWKVDAPYYLAIYSDQEEGCERNAGYLMEQMVLYMTAKGLGTCGLFLPMPALPKWMQPELPALLQSLSVPSHSSPFLIRKTRETACISIAFRFVDSKEGHLKFPLLSRYCSRIRAQ